MNLRTRTMPTGEHPSSSPPPSPAELEEKFPQFEILECLGRGGMGIVYKARQKALDRIVAIKILAGEWQDEPGFAARFEREAKLLAKLNHPHIVTIHDFGSAGGLYYIVMEYVDGVNVRDLLRDGRLEPKQALAIVPPICDALQFAHDHGVVHRDIKPENILLDRDGRVKIADFGIATIAGEAADRSGTPAYMAPEQARHEAAIDHRADIYALGVVLYEMLTGERPGEGIEVPSTRVNVDVRIDEIVLRALEGKPELRYQTAGEFKTVVETVAATSSAPPVAAPQPRVAIPATAQGPQSRDGRFAWIALLLTFVGTPFLLGLASPRQEGAVLFLGICFAIASIVFAIRARSQREGKVVLGIWCGLVLVMVLLTAVYMARERSVFARTGAEMAAKQEASEVRMFAERIRLAREATLLQEGVTPRLRIFFEENGKVSINGIGFESSNLPPAMSRIAEGKVSLPVRITSSHRINDDSFHRILSACEFAGLHQLTFWNSTDRAAQSGLPAVGLSVAANGAVTLDGSPIGPEQLPDALGRLAGLDPLRHVQISALGMPPRHGHVLSLLKLCQEAGFERFFYTTEEEFAERWREEAAKAGVLQPGDVLRIRVAGDGTASLGGRRLAPELMLEELRKLESARPGRPVMIEAAHTAPYSAVTAVLDLCGQASLSNVSFYTETTPGEEEVPLPKVEPDPSVEMILPQGEPDSKDQPEGD
jgi:biopolymer transport protein ExbD/predicted Ser/Thr protein kinase